MISGTYAVSYRVPALLARNGISATLPAILIPYLLCEDTVYGIGTRDQI